MTPCRLIHRYQRFRGICFVNLQGRKVKLEVPDSSETFASFVQSVQSRIPDDDNFAVNIILTTNGLHH
jgi:hypothetical protein